MHVTQQITIIPPKAPVEQTEGPVTYRPTQEELKKYQRLLLKVSEPNCGRIQELKEKIRDGSLLSKEAIRESAARLAARFFGKHRNQL